MLDARTKAAQDRVWDRIGRAVARTGVTANQVTWAGTLLLAAHCTGYTVHERPVLFAAGIALLELTDDLDGAIARVTGTASHDGAYLDAMTDRYKEAFVLFAIATVHGGWPAAFAALFGGLVTSYAKARAGMEVKISNVAWPDLFERLERVVFTCGLLIAVAFVPAAWAPRDDVARGGLALFAVLTNLSALQRFVRARSLLRAHDRANREGR